MKKVLLFSACLLGVKCRYDGRDSRNRVAEDLFKHHGGVVVCPEELGGLSTPRDPAVLRTGVKPVRVVTKGGVDVTDAFARGSEMTVRMAREGRVTHAILKERSPSCGVRFVHSESGVIEGCGMATQALRDMGIKTVSDEDLDEIQF